MFEHSKTTGWECLSLDEVNLCLCPFEKAALCWAGKCWISTQSVKRCFKCRSRKTFCCFPARRKVILGAEPEHPNDIKSARTLQVRCFFSDTHTFRLQPEDMCNSAAWLRSRSCAVSLQLLADRIHKLLLCSTQSFPGHKAVSTHYLPGIPH